MTLRINIVLVAVPIDSVVIEAVVPAAIKVSGEGCILQRFPCTINRINAPRIAFTALEAALKAAQTGQGRYWSGERAKGCR